MESWKKHCPDYEIRRWDETSFDINSNPYVKEAYDAKKYAFVTDYVRLWALSQFGGIYMDIDVEVIKPLDRFLVHHAFSGFEFANKVPTGIMASEKGGLWAARELQQYDDRHFIKEDGTYDLTTNVFTITNNLRKEGFLLNNTYQDHRNIITMYPMEYFCPEDQVPLKNTYTIHHFCGSWCSPRKRFVKRMKQSVQQFMVCRIILSFILKTRRKLFLNQQESDE